MTIDHARIAAELIAAADRLSPVGLLTERHPELVWEDARRIARASDRLRLDRGERQIGWKLGWTSAVMREALGVDRPNWGTLWATQELGPIVPRTAFIHPKIEPELVWRAPVGLSGDDVTAEDVAACGGTWALGLEVVDPRFPSFEFDALDNTADNSSSAGIRLGPFVSLDDDPASVTVAFAIGSEPPRVGAASEAMGSPLEAVAWLVRSLADEGLGVRAGDIVFTGGLARPVDGAAGVSLRLSGPAPLGVVDLAFG